MTHMLAVRNSRDTYFDGRAPIYTFSLLELFASVLLPDMSVRPGGDRCTYFIPPLDHAKIDAFIEERSRAGLCSR